MGEWVRWSDLEYMQAAFIPNTKKFKRHASNKLQQPCATILRVLDRWLQRHQVKLLQVLSDETQ